jgi:RNA polymerase primary sigma factor
MPIQTYLDELAGHPPLDAESERELTTALRDARVELWTLVLLEPTTATEVLGRLAGEEDYEVPAEEVKELARAAEAGAEPYRVVNERLSDLLVDVVPDFDAAVRACEIAQGRSPDRAAELSRERDRAGRLRQHLARSNLRLVVSIARAYPSAVSLGDRIQEGNIGLMTAVDRFDPRRGNRFSTYASWWIRHGILRAIQDRGRLIRLPVHADATRARIEEARGRLTTELGRPPSLGELADDLRMRRDKLLALETYGSRPRLISLNALADEGDRPLSERLADPRAEEEMSDVESRCDADLLREAVRSLPAIDYDVLRKSFGLDGEERRSYAAIGREYSLSRERIRQIRQRALGRVRRELRRRFAIPSHLAS